MQQIILYGLSEEEMDIVYNYSGLRCEWMLFDVYQDVIAHYADLTIMNPEALDAEGRDCLNEFYHEIDPVNEKVIMTKYDPVFSDISFVEIIEGFFDDPYMISLIIMKAIKETKRDVDFSRRIMLAIKIMKLIEEHPGITTREISAKVEQSDRSTKRYIRSLQAADIMIEYNNKGWYCSFDPKEMV